MAAVVNIQVTPTSRVQLDAQSLDASVDSWSILPEEYKLIAADILQAEQSDVLPENIS
jgi:hypothetical protein